MRKVRVMWLDSGEPHSPRMEGVEFEVVWGRWSEADSYHPGPEETRAVEQVTAAGGVDLVVIGNNMGAGQKFAKVVAEPLRSRAIVVWNSEPREGDKRPYEALGLSHFGARHELGRLIVEMVREMP